MKNSNKHTRKSPDNWCLWCSTYEFRIEEAVDSYVTISYYSIFHLAFFDISAIITI